MPVVSTKDYLRYGGLKSLQTNNLDTLDYKEDQKCWCWHRGYIGVHDCTIGVQSVFRVPGSVCVHMGVLVR